MCRLVCAPSAPVINVIEAQDSAPTPVGNGREPGLELSSDSKVREEAGRCSHSVSSLSR